MNPPATITAPQFQALCAILWGDGWRPQAANALGVSMRNVQFWAAEPPARSKPVPAGVVRELFEAVGRLDAARIDAAVDRQAAQLEILVRAIGFEDLAAWFDR